MQNMKGEMENVNGEMRNVIGDASRKRERLSSPSQYGRRKSCDACRQKKKRCDQKQPCSRCARSGIDCKYSKNRCHHAGHSLHRQQRYFSQSDRGAVTASEHRLRSTQGALVASYMLPLKRCRLRASPATGLVGMQENDFLSDFFGCVGFLPLANESEIREAMVKIMAPTYPREEAASSTDCYREDGQSGTLSTDSLPKDPSYSIFWSAVALGALAKGCPFKAVDRYCQFAGEALAACRFGTTSVELAKASAILTHVYSLKGDMAKFREYLTLSEWLLKASIEQGSTDVFEGLPDLLLHFRKVGNVESGPLDASWAPPEGPPQLDRFATKGDLYRFIAQSFRVFDQAVYDKAQERCGRGLERLYSWGPSHRNFDPNDPLPGEVSEAIRAVGETTKSLGFEPLEETADRPSIRAGVGDLLINGTLLFENAAKGDLCATLEKLDRIVEVYERYPGLCRCMMGSHISHALLATLVAIDDSRARGMYERLREAFNSCRTSHTPPIPPREEWQGVAAICEDFHCRVIETLIKSEHMKAFTTPSVTSVHDGPGLARTTSNRHRESKGRISPTSDADGETIHRIQASPCNTWTGENSTSKCTKHDAVCGTGAVVVPLASESYPGGQSEARPNNACAAHGVATKSFDPSLRSAGTWKHRVDRAWLEDDEIAPADLLEVVNAVLNAVHA